MENCFGMGGTATVDVIICHIYLTKVSINVRVNNAVSELKHIDLSVPQGIINGPIYFT